MHRALKIMVFKPKFQENDEYASWVLSLAALEHFVLKEAEVINEHDILVSLLQLLRALL